VTVAERRAATFFRAQFTLSLEELTVHTRLSHSLPAAILVALGTRSTAAQTPAPAPPQVTAGSVVYAQYGYQLKDTANHVNTFTVTRAYVNVIGRLSGGVYARVTSDMTPSGTSSLALRLKYAYVAYTPNASALTYKFGLLHTPWLDWEEALWDYRMQGTMAFDRNGFLTAADFGAGIDGKWRDDRVNGQVTVVNGEGYSGGPGDQRKDVQGRVSVRVLDTDDNTRVGGLRVTGYAGVGKFTGGPTRNRFVGVLSYRSKQFTLAGEYGSVKDTATTKSIISAFGVFRVQNSGFAAIGRIDLFDSNTSVSGDHQTRFIAGISYQVSPNLRVLADIDNLAYQGGSPTPALEATRSQALFQTQFTF
jgi:hypothetical protein